MKTLKVLIFAGFITVLSACNNDIPQEPVTDNEQTGNGDSNVEDIVIPTFTDAESLTLYFSDTEYAAAEAINSFGIDFFVNICNDTDNKENTIISPLSISIFLSMLSNICTVEDTQNICNALGYSNIADINDVCRKLLVCLPKADAETALTLSNAFWYHNEYTIHPVFDAILQQYYTADVFEADFVSQRSTVIDAINGWTAAKTNNRIPQLINYLPNETIAFLINALYFKSKWASPFPTESTKKETFRGTNGNTTVDMMHSTCPYLHKTPNYTAFSEGFTNNTAGFKAMFVLPNDENDDLSTLNSAELKKLLKSGREEYCIPVVSLPRFEINPQNNINITETLQKYGIVKDMSYLSDRLFTELTPLEMKILHRANISFNEEGAEGSAVTFDIIDSLSGAVKYVPLKFDRPFLFFIYETYTGNCIFAGRCTNI